MSLPTDGAALLRFKQQTEPPADLAFGRAGVALDDPAERLAELEGFDELPPADADELQAAAAATEAAAALAAAVEPPEELRPWFEAMQNILDVEVEDIPELPVQVSTHMLLGDGESAADVASLRTACTFLLES